MRCRKVRSTLWYNVSNKPFSLEKFAHRVLLLFQPFRGEKEFLENIIKRFFLSLIRPWLAMSIHIAKLKIMQHQWPNIPMTMIQKTRKETNFLQFPTFYLSCMLLDNEIAGGMNSLNWKQREVYNVVDNVGTMLNHNPLQNIWD